MATSARRSCRERLSLERRPSAGRHGSHRDHLGADRLAGRVPHQDLRVRHLALVHRPEGNVQGRGQYALPGCFRPSGVGFRRIGSAWRVLRPWRGTGVSGTRGLPRRDCRLCHPRHGSTDRALNEKAALRRPFLSKNRRRPTLPGGCPPSTIGAGGLNFSVRNGKRCFPAAMTAGNCEVVPLERAACAPSKLHSSFHGVQIKTSGY